MQAKQDPYIYSIVSVNEGMDRYVNAQDVNENLLAV